MINWQPLESELNAHVPGPSPEGPAWSAFLGLSNDDITPAYVVPPPGGGPVAPLATVEILSELVGLESLRGPLIRALARLAREHGASERELVDIARQICRVYP